MSEWIAGQDIKTVCNCGKPAPFKCAWKLRRPFMIWAKDLRVGDQMQIPKKLGYSQVIAIKPGYTAAWLHVTLSVMPRLEPYYSISPGTPIMAMRPGCCEAPCCDDCGQQVDPERPEHRYCRAHWNHGAAERPDTLDQREEVEA